MKQLMVVEKLHAMVTALWGLYGIAGYRYDYQLALSSSPLTQSSAWDRIIVELWKILDRIFPKKEEKPAEKAYHPTYWDGIQRSRERKNIPYTFKSRTQ